MATQDVVNSMMQSLTAIGDPTSNPDYVTADAAVTTAQQALAAAIAARDALLTPDQMAARQLMRQLRQMGNRLGGGGGGGGGGQGGQGQLVVTIPTPDQVAAMNVAPDPVTPAPVTPSS